MTNTIPQEIKDIIGKLFKKMRGGYFMSDDDNQRWCDKFVDDLSDLLASKGFSIVDTKNKYVLDREQLKQIFVEGFNTRASWIQFDSLLAELTGQANPRSETEGTEEEK